MARDCGTVDQQGKAPFPSSSNAPKMGRGSVMDLFERGGYLNLFAGSPRISISGLTFWTPCAPNSLLNYFFFFFLRKRESFSEPLLAWLAQPCRNFIKSHQGNRCGGELKWGCFRKMAGEALTEHIFMSKPPGGAVPMGLGGAGDSAFLTSSQVRLLPPGVPQPKALSKRCLPQWWLLEPPDDWMGAPE